MKTLSDYYDEPEEFTTLSKLTDYYQTELPGKGWIFRGHKDGRLRRLENTLERFLARMGLPQSQGETYEAQMIRQVRRCAKIHFPVKDIPESDDHFGWLALMQHYGTPTRLLDWTYSFFVALYFALEEYDPRGNPFAIWAVNSNDLDAVVMKQIWHPGLFAMQRKDRGERAKDLMNVLLRYGKRKKLYPSASVVTMTPFERNPRLSAQQGTFLVTSSPSLAFEAALMKVLERLATPTRASFKKLVCRFSAEEFHRSLGQLYRWNLTPAALYTTGPDGFAKTIKQRIALASFRDAESEKHDPFASW